MKVNVKRVKGGVVIVLGLRHARRLKTILGYSSLNKTFEEWHPKGFKSAEIVSQMIFDQLCGKGVETFV